MQAIKFGRFVVFAIRADGENLGVLGDANSLEEAEVIKHQASLSEEWKNALVWDSATERWPFY